MRILNTAIRTEIKNCQNLPKQIKRAYTKGGAKSVIKEIGPATTCLTVIGTVIPAPLTSVVGFGLGKIIDKALKVFNVIK